MRLPNRVWRLLPDSHAVFDGLGVGATRRVWLGYQRLLYQLLRDGGKVS